MTTSWQNQQPPQSPAPATTLAIGHMTLNRMGFGAMRLCGDFA